jgi:hypothetical protein
MTREEKLKQNFKVYRMQCNELILQIHGHDVSGYTIDDERLMNAMQSGIKPIDVAIEFKLDTAFEDE